MNVIAKREIGVVGLLLVILGVSLAPSLLHARREKRDGERRDALAQLKRQLEDINNKRGYYPIDFSAEPFTFIITESEGKAATAWYLRAELENPAPETAGKDLEADRNYYFRIVREGERTLYDVCGGKNRCGVAESEEGP